MNMDNLKSAFGSTPDSVKQCVLRSLREEQRSERIMKRKLKVSMAIALAAILLLGCAALAATRLEGLAGAFSLTNPETGETVVNEAALKHITALNEVYEGKAVRFTLNEGMYSPLNRYVSMSWTLEPLTEGEQYYILCNELVGGWPLVSGSMRNVTEFILKSPVSCALSGYPEGDGLQTELNFCVLKIKGEPIRVSWEGEKEKEEEFWQRMDALIAEGKLPMEGDGMIVVRSGADTTYAEELVIAGAAELVEEFTVSFDLSQIAPVDEYREYAGEKNFSFEGFDIQISDVVVTPANSRIVFDVLSETEITLEDIGSSTCVVDASVEGMEVWYKSAHPRYIDRDKTEDGRWKVTFAYETAQQIVYPEELIFTITDYDDPGNPIPLTGEGIRLKLTDR